MLMKNMVLPAIHRLDPQLDKLQLGSDSFPIQLTVGHHFKQISVQMSLDLPVPYGPLSSLLQEEILCRLWLF